MDWNALQPQELPYPFETVRHWYVTPFGGRSKDLSPGQVGINSAALENNTKLVPVQDRVLISIVGRGDTKPLYTRSPFQVVALDSKRPDGLGRSPYGEAVLPLEEVWDFIESPYLLPKEGEALLLNSVTARLFGRDPSEVLAGLFARGLRSRRDPLQ